MLRSLSTVPLPAGIRAKLLNAGYLFCDDIHMQKEDIDGNEACKVLKKLSNDPVSYWKSLISIPVTCSALDIWQQEESRPSIVTFCKAVDDALGGGISVCSITELCGGPGSGKTQMCLQLSVDVQIPVELGGLGSEALFIDTESGFSTQRLLEIADSCVQHCQSVAQCQGQQNLMNFTSQSILQNVHYIHRQSVPELIATVPLIKDLLRSGANVKLIVIDSITFPFLQNMSAPERTGILYHLMEDLQMLAYTHGIAIVVTNQITTWLRPGSQWTLMPSLSDSFASRVNTCLRLKRVSGTGFIAEVTKSPICPHISLPFQVNHCSSFDFTLFAVYTVFSSALVDCSRWCEGHMMLSAPAVTYKTRSHKVCTFSWFVAVYYMAGLLFTFLALPWSTVSSRDMKAVYSLHIFLYTKYLATCPSCNMVIT